jgi:transposase-like protein
VARSGGDGPDDGRAVEDVMRGIKKALIERALQAELSHHLGYAEGEDKPEASANQRNGTSGKTVLTDDGPLRIDIPRDRAGQFEPQLIGKHERRFTGFDDKIIAMYARGMSVREIQAFLVQMYNTEVSPDFISQVTDAVMDEVRSGRAGRWRRCIRWCSSTRCGSRSARTRWCATRRCSGAGVRADGSRDILGLWIEHTEGAKFWLKVFNDLKLRGCQDILIAVTDGLKGMAEALEAVYPAARCRPASCICCATA